MLDSVTHGDGNCHSVTHAHGNYHSFAYGNCYGIAHYDERPHGDLIAQCDARIYGRWFR